MTRRMDLEAHIRTSYELLASYEHIVQLSADPKERARSRRECEEQWALIREYLAEYRRIAPDLPADIAEIAAHFDERVVPTQPALVLVPEHARPAKFPGLIVIAGIGRPEDGPWQPERDVAWAAIQYHLSTKTASGLQYCWILASPEAAINAAALQAACQAQGVTAEICPVESGFSIQAAYDAVQHIYLVQAPRVGLTAQQVIADFTGGAKPLSAGMLLACGDRRPMQYMYGRKAGIASTPRLVDFAARE